MNGRGDKRPLRLSRKPPSPREVSRAKRRDGGSLSLTDGVPFRGKAVGSLSHGCAVPAPSRREPSRREPSRRVASLLGCADNRLYTRKVIYIPLVSRPALRGSFFSAERRHIHARACTCTCACVYTGYHPPCQGPCKPPRGRGRAETACRTYLFLPDRHAGKREEVGGGNCKNFMKSR